MENSSSHILYLGGIPYSWSPENVKSVLKGSGRITDVRLKMDTNGRNKGYCFIEYASAQDAIRAMSMLNGVLVNGRKRFRIEQSKEGLRNNPLPNKPVLELSRQYIPPEVQLPSSMTVDDSGLFSNSNGQQGGGGYSDQLMPSHLLEAANKLPPINKECFESDSKVSQNLEAIPPSQVIQLIASLKNLLINKDYGSASSILSLSPQLTIAIAQALLLMGFVDNDVIMQAASSSTPSSSTSTASSAIPPPPAPVPAPAPLGLPPMPIPSNSQYQNFLPASHPQPTNNLQPFTNNGLVNPNIPPEWNSLPPKAVASLSQMDRNQATIIAQVLLLPPDQFASLPPEQRTAIQQIRLQYL